MKKLLIISVIILLSFSKKTIAQDFEGGLSAGIDFTQVDGDLSAGFEKFGFQGGFVLTNKFKNDVSFMTELKYIQKGSRNVHTNQSSYIYYVIRLQYIEMPIVFSYPVTKIYDKPYLKKISLAGGLTLGYLLKAEEDEDGYGFLPANPPFNKYELGYIAGINYKLNTKLYASAMFGYSVFRVRAKPCGTVPWYYFTTCGQYNRSVQLSLIYKFIK